MKINLQFEIKPFTTPNYVRRLRNGSPGTLPTEDADGIPLSELDAQTLDRLCNQFRDDVFRKAGKTRPLNISHFEEVSESLSN